MGGGRWEVPGRRVFKFCSLFLFLALKAQRYVNTLSLSLSLSSVFEIFLFFFYFLSFDIHLEKLLVNLIDVCFFFFLWGCLFFRRLINL